METSILSGKVREIARIRGFGDQNSVKTPCISVQKVQGKSPGSDKVVISFSGEQTTSIKSFNFEVDQYYDHEATNAVVFTEEVQPLVTSVFEGKSATVFAYGARGSGKTYTIQGSQDIPGLISLCVSEVLSRAEEIGNSISLSLYEVLQDRVFDLLDSKKPEISVLEGANGKIVMKGLSKAPIKSMSEFLNLWLQRPLQKTTNEPPQRSHIGMIINISSAKDASLLGRMNLVDLAGYEDKRQSISGVNLVEISKINKSLYAVHNVLHALKSNDTRVPYRESKLTRMLQDSLGGINRILMITCMDPSFPEDTIKTLSLASRSCQVVNKTKVDLTSNVRSLIKPTTTPSRSSKQTVALSSKLVKVASSSASTRKPITSILRSVEGKPQDVKVQGRRLFEELKSDNRKKETKSKKNMEVTESSRQEETMSGKNIEVTGSSAKEIEPMSEKNIEVTEFSNKQEEKMFENKMELTGTSSCTENATQLSLDVFVNETGVNTPSTVQPISAIPSELELEDSTQTSVDTQMDNLVKEIPVDDNSLVTLDILHADKENKTTTLNEGPSPPLSARLQELSNNLRSLYTSTPNMKTELLGNYNSIKEDEKLGSDFLEPSTPLSQTVNNDTKCQYTNLMSPWERLQIRSTGMKESLVRECLMFINSASKEELKGLKGIGEARANYILKLRDESPEPFKSLDDLKDIGLSSKQINGMMKTVAGGIFD